MAKEIFLIKSANNTFCPADEESAETCRSVKLGTTTKATLTQPRNVQFLKKYMVLIGLGFDLWEPEQKEWRGIQAVKSAEVYRKQVQILAGYSDVTYNIDGSIKVESQSVY